jgi:glycosyltransferase involved in cell wall biosynthesis
VLLFIGEPRPEKGFRLVVDALDGLLAIAPQIHVRFVLPRLGQTNDERIRRYDPNRVSLLIDPALPIEAIHREIARAKLVLCPYDPAAYRYRCSSIYLESIALGVPAVFTAGMAAEDEFLDHGGIGAVAAPATNVGALVRTVAKAVDDLDRLTAEARSLAPAFREMLCRTPWVAYHTSGEGT